MSSHVKDLARPVWDRVMKFKTDQPFYAGIIVGAVGAFLFSFFVH